ncbi:lipopolysaccharide kinase InaA family protein [Geoalkalibacter subterraneus]|uniref:lipopolysaccharide kinase InaA family protein n=1 Tax=Geoalkalibacter subterraneus TaxID=483547 RepID=UPI00130E8C05|nr:lipopolysaccharide kinase InaA family protein [Geoalkalibacter subterraneus]
MLEKDAYGPKVLLCDEEVIVKVFRRKRFFSRALFSPPARRFAQVAQKLIQRGITTVTVLRYGQCCKPARDLVWYRYLPGETLRWHCQRPGADLPDLMQRLGSFVALLHQRGVLFRSLHWGNILVQPDGEFALIDILDLRLQNQPLRLHQRRRNFRHLLRYEQDALILQPDIESFWRGYKAVARLADGQIRALRRLDITSRK